MIKTPWGKSSAVLWATWQPPKPRPLSSHFAVRDVTPNGNRTQPATFLGRSVHVLGQIWHTAGSRQVFFATTATKLETLTSGRVITVD